MIIGKKQIIIASLVLILGVAIYLNWQFASSDQALTVAEILGTDTPTSSNATYGQAELVNSSEDANDYFDQARLDKQKSRDEESESLATIMNDPSLTDDQKSQATLEATNIAKMSEEETTIENQVKAKGFEDCIAYVDDSHVNVTVKAPDMDAAQAAQIKDVIINVTGTDPSNIVVTPVE